MDVRQGSGRRGSTLLLRQREKGDVPVFMDTDEADRRGCRERLAMLASRHIQILTKLTVWIHVSVSSCDDMEGNGGEHCFSELCP